MKAKKVIFSEISSLFGVMLDFLGKKEVYKNYRNQRLSFSTRAKALKNDVRK